jgi:PAS domain S-box-containing protein
MERTVIELAEALHLAQTRHALVLALVQTQRKASDPERMMNDACKVIGLHLGVDRVGFFEKDDADQVRFGAGWTAGRLPLLTGTFPAAGIGQAYLGVLRTGRTLAISDVQADPLASGSRFSELGVVAVVGVPIVRGGTWQAVFCIHQAAARQWTEDELVLAQEVGEQTWDAVERVRVANALRLSEERLSLALDASGLVGTWDWDVAADLVYTDSRFATLFSVDPARAAAGAPLAAFVQGIHPDDREAAGQQIRQAIETGEPFAAEYRVLLKDGTVRWVSARGRSHLDAADKTTRFPGVVIDITDRKRMELDLLQQWHQFDTVLSHSVDFAYIFDLEGRFTYSNGSLARLLNRTLPEMLGKNFYDLNYPHDLAARLHAQIQHVIDTGEVVKDQTPFTGPDGRSGTFEYIFVPVAGLGGKVEAVAGTTREVTERIKAEKLLEEDRRRWRELLQKTPAAIALLRGAELRYEWVNDAYVELMGRPAEALVGTTAAEAMPPIEREHSLALLKYVYETGEASSRYEAPLRSVGKDARPDAYVNCVYLPTRGVDGAIDGIFMHATDVTALVRGRKKVEESEQRFRQLADSLPQIVWTADAQGVVDYFNQRWYDLTGFKRNEGDQIWLPLLHPEDAARAADTWLKAVQSGHQYQIEYRFWDRHLDRWKWYMGRAVPVRDTAGRVVRWFGTATDIDEQKALQEATLQKQKLEGIGLLAGGIAHDFNNLLVGILGGATFALDTLNERHPAYAMLQNVVNSSERAAHLTRQLLAYAGKGRFLVEPVDISRMTHETIQIMGSSIPNAVHLELELAGGLPTVDTDIGQIQSVVLNLVLNAAESFGDGKKGTVVVRTRLECVGNTELRYGVDRIPVVPGDYVVLEVQDSGTGIDPKTQSKIFDPFFSTKFTGRGLGLAAVSGVVRSHRGAIELDSELGKGSTFRVLLPAGAQQAEPGVPPRAEPAARGRETVLVIDDEPMVRQVAQVALTKSGYQAIVAENGEAGLNEVRRNDQISLVLLDMSMPGLSGREVLEKLRELRPALPVMICSGYSEDEVHREFSGIEITEVLQKPFTTRNLNARVRMLLDAERV